MSEKHDPNAIPKRKQNIQNDDTHDIANNLLLYKLRFDYNLNQNGYL